MTEVNNVVLVLLCVAPFVTFGLGFVAYLVVAYFEFLRTGPGAGK